MNTAELNEVYSAFLGILDDAGLGWIGIQVNEEITAGRVVARVPTRPARQRGEFAHDANAYETIDFSQSRPLAKGAAIATEPYGGRDRVQALIRAVRRAISDCAAIEQHVSTFLAQEPSLQARSELVKIFSTDDDESADRVMLATADYRLPETHLRLLQLLDQFEARVVSDE